MLRLDKDKFLKDIKIILNDALDKISQTLIEYMIFEISQIPNSGSINAVGKPDWRNDVMDALKYKAINSGLNLSRRIGLIDQSDNLVYKAMIIEYGMGVEADTSDNPWISEYLASEYYHPERGGMEVYGRKDMQVYNIDDGGWEDSGATHTDEITYFRQIGSKFWTNVFGNSSTIAKTDFNIIIDEAIRTIDISKYIVVTKR